MDLAITIKEVETSIKDPKVQTALLSTVFKNFPVPMMQEAILAGVLRGFTLKDFLEKNVYAIKYGDTYSLVTSIDNNRKIGMRSGVVGTTKPTYKMTDKQTPGNIPMPESCEITVKRLVNGTTGYFTSEVYFDEYYKAGKTYQGKYTPSMWDTKPRTMIAKVAEMHALRKACPEELSQVYVEEEMEKEATKTAMPTFDLAPYKAKLEEVENLTQLRTAWAALPGEAKKELEGLKNEIKAKLTPKTPEAPKAKVHEAEVVAPAPVETVQILSPEEEAAIG